MKGLANFMESGINRIITVAVLVTVNLLFNGYNFTNVGKDIKFLKSGEINRIELNIMKQQWKIANDPEDIKPDDFEAAFEGFAKLRGQPECEELVSRISPVIENLRDYYKNCLL